MTAVTDQAYPFATREGDAIPNDIIHPRSLVPYILVANTPQTIAIPAGYTAVFVFSNKDCILALNSTPLVSPLVSGQEYLNAVFIPANMPMTVLVAPGAAQLLPLGSGTLFMVSIEQWAALKRANQLTTG